MSFPCTRCGLCCQNIHHVPALASFHNGDGVCIYFRQGAGCIIYEERPLECRIDDGYLHFFASQLSLADYYQKNAETCNKMQLEAGSPNNYRVKL